ncbi:MAG: orotate phosphoribosyltransferase, partial [Bacteroidales bacterium]|nr:orotate phosphoribosyltransferase [Bacteroidales bacterium]
GSSLKAVKALREANCNVKGMVAIFTYNLKVAIDNFEKEKCKLITLADYDILVKQAVEKDFIKDSDMQSLIEWREHPKKWGERFN